MGVQAGLTLLGNGGVRALNPKQAGLTLLHDGGVGVQAGLTLLGNTTVALAALRIALASGHALSLPTLPAWLLQVP